MSALAQLYGVEGELSEVARRGSGSACRSMLGGFVQWLRGERPDGRDSLAHQVAPETHWPELRVLVLVVRDWGDGGGHGCTHPRPPAGWDLGGGCWEHPSPVWVQTSGLRGCPSLGLGAQGGHAPPPVPPQVSGEKKQVGSTAGMQTSVDTSPLLKVWGNGPDPAPGSCLLPACRQALGSHFPWGGHFSVLGGMEGGQGGCTHDATQAKPKGSRCRGCP